MSGLSPSASAWQQLYHLWELIVLICKFLWQLLLMLGGKGGG